MIAPIPKFTITLTGNIRARPGWFGKQILQVQELITPEAAERYGMEPRQENEYRWRDATWRDIVTVFPPQL